MVPNTSATRVTAPRVWEEEYTVRAVSAMVQALGFTHWKRTACIKVMGFALAGALSLVGAAAVAI